MQYFAEGALSRHGAEDSFDDEDRRAMSGVEESLYMLELPTMSVEASLDAAVRLRLRPDPDRSTQGGKIGQACEKVRRARARSARRPKRRLFVSGP